MDVDQSSCAFIDAPELDGTSTALAHETNRQERKDELATAVSDQITAGTPDSPKLRNGNYS
jgi:hypothetical protein